VNEVCNDGLKIATDAVGMAGPPFDDRFARVLDQEVDNGVPTLPIRVMNGIERLVPREVSSSQPRIRVTEGTLERDGRICIDDGDKSEAF